MDGFTRDTDFVSTLIRQEGMTFTASRPRRSVLYVPAANPRAMAKVRQLDCDAVVFDLEDAVAPQMKEEARRHLVEAFAASSIARRETVIRVNAVDTGEFALDMDAVARCNPDAVLLPKVEHPDALAALGSACRTREIGDAMQAWAMVETPAGLLELDRIVNAGRTGFPRLDCLVVGTNDLAKETGVSTDDGRAWMRPWLMHVVLVARRHGITALDGVWNEFSDSAGFEAEVHQGRKMGFDGKTLIHPNQVDAANRAFAATKEAIADARRIVDAFAQPEHAGAGVINLQGRMLERLHLHQAERLLAIDRAIAERQAGKAWVEGMAENRA